MQPIIHVQPRRQAVARFFRSLRVKMAVGVVLPALLVSQMIPLVHAWRERLLVDEQIRVIETQLSRTLVGSITYAMQLNDRAMLATVLQHVTDADNIQRVRVTNFDSEVTADSQAADTAKVRVDAGCDGCHQLPVGTRPAAMSVNSVDGMLRIATPIDPQPECMRCHTNATPHLGVLLADVSLQTLNEHLNEDLKTDLIMAALISVALAIVVYLMLSWLIVRRVEGMRQPLMRYAEGDFSQRLPTSGDELGDLAGSFNTMAQQLEQYTHEQRERVKVRQRAIVEERERIARELHDGMAQLLGYVNTKVMAVRLMLKNNQIEPAERQLAQLEEAARGLFVDVREAILGLKMAGHNASLMDSLTDYARQFSRLSDIPVKMIVDPGINELHLPAETELQLLRIVQEALTNIRKHANATQANLHARRDANHLELTISDNGHGFEPDRQRPDRSPTFGLSTMRERADAIGAEFYLNTKPGIGTTLTIRLPLPV